MLYATILRREEVSSDYGKAIGHVSILGTVRKEMRMRCMECGGVLIETVKTIKTTVKSGSFCVEGIPHYKCESCGSIEFGTGVMEKMTAVV